ncbi:MAG: chemotaxis protein CheW [Spirochaetes bacterium]|nr:chemotaxis protein CheW [Spirochaetota bacterium]
MNKNEIVERTVSTLDEDSIEQDDELVSEDDIEQIVSFSLSNEVEYGIDILQIHEILRVVDISRLPNTPDFIMGVINLRGKVIPVVNVRKRFGYSENKFTEETRIIVVGVGSKLIGLLVDRVFQVIRIPKDNISSPSELIEGVSAEFIHGVGRLRNRLMIILKLDNMLFPEKTE